MRAALSTYCQHTPTWTTKPLTQLGRITKCPRHIPQLAKNKFTFMHNYLHVCVTKRRRRGADSKSILATHYFQSSLSMVPPLHIFGTSSGLDTEWKKQEVSLQWFFAAMLHGTAFSSLWVPDSAVTLEPSTTRCHSDSCWTKRNN